MKKYLMLIVFLILTACDQPQTVRYGGLGGYKQNPVGTNDAGNNTGIGGDLEDGFTSTGNTSFDTTTENELGPGFEFCNLQSPHYIVDTGNFSLCQSEASETQFVLKVNASDYSQGTCIIPMNTNPQGVSVYLGPAQCSYHSKNQILRGTLYKTRAGYETRAINSVMVMKRTTLNSFLNCMEAVTNFTYKNCPNCPNNCSSQSWYQCLNSAQAQMSQMCNYFESQGNYIQISF
jgi:hypothetical protein